MRPLYHVLCLYSLIAMLMVLSYQRHSKLQATIQLLHEFQMKSSETRLHIITELDELQNRLNVLEHYHGHPTVTTVRPTDTTGNRK
jgi:hypothetical protein